MRIKQEEEEDGEEILKKEEENQLAKRQGTAAGYNRLLLGTVVPCLYPGSLWLFLFGVDQSLWQRIAAQRCFAPLDKSKWAR